MLVGVGEGVPGVGGDFGCRENESGAETRMKMYQGVEEEM